MLWLALGHHHSHLTHQGRLAMCPRSPSRSTQAGARAGRESPASLFCLLALWTQPGFAASQGGRKSPGPAPACGVTLARHSPPGLQGRNAFPRSSASYKPLSKEKGWVVQPLHARHLGLHTGGWG